jgi:2'-5' RNA ligase
MSVIRAFIAIELSEEIQSQLEQVTAVLKNRSGGLPIRWVPVENVHLTLKFLGDVSLSNLELLKKMLRSVGSAHHPFEVSAGGLGTFPNPHRPRVIWIGLEAPAEMASLQHAVDVDTARLGYDREERPFSPHLTVGRVSRNASPAEIRAIARVVEESRVGFLGAAWVEAVHLFKSELQPGGAVYTCLFSAPLAERTARES